MRAHPSLLLSYTSAIADVSTSAGPHTNASTVGAGSLSSPCEITMPIGSSTGASFFFRAIPFSPSVARGDQQTQQSQVGHDEHPPVVPFRSAVELRVSGDPDCTTDAKRPNEGKSLYDNDLPVGVPTEVALLCRSMTLLT